jgi:glycosyltransferase involved in cell wall biosynthesis
MKVSIVIPTYKRVDYLDRLLKSIEAQTFKDFEEDIEIGEIDIQAKYQYA